MGSYFLSSDDVTLEGLSDGTSNLKINSIIVNSLVSDKFVKTDSVDRLTSGDIVTSDITGLDTELQKIDNFTASTQGPDITNLTGRLDVDEISAPTISDPTQTSQINLNNTNIDVTATNFTFNGNDVLTSASDNTLQEVYDASTPAVTQLTTTKPLTVKAVDTTNILNIDGDTKSVDITANNLNYNASTVVTEASLPNTTTIQDLDKYVNLDSSSGTITGGIISRNPINPFTWDITAGSGTINFNDTITHVSWPASQGNATSLLAAVNGIYVPTNGIPIAIPSDGKLNPSRDRENITIGAIGLDPTGIIIDVVNANVPLRGAVNQIKDLASAIGIFNLEGNLFGPNGANMILDKTLGKIFFYGSNFHIDRDNPNIATIPAQMPVPFYVPLTQTGPQAGLSSAIDSANYDVNGVVTPLPGGSGIWTVQRIYITGLQPTVLVEYGQTIYNSIQAAEDGIPQDPHISSIGEGFLLRAFLIVKKGTIDLTLADNKFISAGKFGSASGSSGAGASNVTLDLAYSNSGGASTVNVDAGDLTFEASGVNSIVNRSIGTGTFKVQNSAGVNVLSVPPAGSCSISATTNENIELGVFGTGSLLQTIFSADSTSYTDLYNATGKWAIRDGSSNEYLSITGAGNITCTPPTNAVIETTMLGTGDNIINLDGTGSTFRVDGSASDGLIQLTDAGAVNLNPSSGLDQKTTLLANSSNITDLVSATSSFEIQDNTVPVVTVSGAGAISMAPTSGLGITTTVAGVGNISNVISGTGSFIVNDGAADAFIVANDGDVDISKSGQLTTVKGSLQVNEDLTVTKTTDSLLRVASEDAARLWLDGDTLNGDDTEHVALLITQDAQNNYGRIFLGGSDTDPSAYNNNLVFESGSNSGNPSFNHIHFRVSAQCTPGSLGVYPTFASTGTRVCTMDPDAIFPGESGIDLGKSTDKFDTIYVDNTKSDDIDALTGVALNIGGTTASSVNISKASVLTVVKGDFETRGSLVSDLTVSAGTSYGSIGATEHMIQFTNASAKSCILPALGSSQGRVLEFFNTGAGNLTINRAGSDVIDGSLTSFTVSEWGAVRMVGIIGTWMITT